MNTPEEVGALVRQARKSLGQTQTEMGTVLGIDQSTLSTIELGRYNKVTASNIAKIAKLLGKSFQEVAKCYGLDLDTEIVSRTTSLQTAAPAVSQPAGYVPISYATAREILRVIERARGGPLDGGSYLNRLMLQVSRHLPDTELPQYLGGDFEEEEDEED